jgi:hypothetical protein
MNIANGNEWDAISKPASAGEWDAISKPAGRRATDPEEAARRIAADRELYSPDKGMSGLEKFTVGAGAEASKAWQGLKGLVGADTSKDEEDAALYQKYRPEGWQTTAGEIAGGIGAQAPLALIPGGALAQIAAQGAGAAAMTPGDLAERAKAGGIGAAGAAGGQLLTKALGRVAKPIGDKAVDTVALEAVGVKPTFGQGMAQKGTALGKAIGKSEEGALSVPLASAPLAARRAEGMADWQRATREAVLPAGAPKAAAESVDTARKAVSDAYETALSKEGLPYASVTYQPDLRALSAGLPISQAQRDLVDETFNAIRLKHMQNPTPGVQATAAGAHGTESEMKTLAARYMGSQDPAQQDLGQLFNKVAHEYGQTWRGALQGATTRSEIAALDRGYPALKAVQQAAKTTGAAASEGVPSAYSPAVLTRAARTVDRTPNKSQYIRGEAPQQELARLGQTMQTKLPDSGTVSRALTGMGIMGGAGLSGMSVPAIAGALSLAGYGTKTAQDFLMGRLAPKAQEAILQALRKVSVRGGGTVGAGTARAIEDQQNAP